MTTFSLSDEQNQKYMDWDTRHYPTCIYYKHSGAIGGRLTFLFAPNSVGTVVRIKCACGEEIDLSDYENW